MRLISLASRLVGQRSRLAGATVMANLVAAAPAAAQSRLETTEAAPAVSVVHQDDDAALSLAERDFVVNLPTTLRLPRFNANFRLMHRFAGNLRSGTLSQQARNLFAIDQGRSSSSSPARGLIRITFP